VKETASASLVYSLETEMSPSQLHELLRFLYDHFLLRRPDVFRNVLRTTIDGEPILTYSVFGPGEKWFTNVEIRAGRPILISLIPSDSTIPPETLRTIREDILTAIQFFDENLRMNSLYFAWTEGAKISPEVFISRSGKALGRLFLETMVLFFIVFFIGSIVLFSIAPAIAPIILIAAQFVFVLFSDRIVMRLGDWKVTADNPRIHILRCQLSPEEFKDVSNRYTRAQFMEMKKEILERTFATGRQIDAEIAADVFTKYGIKCLQENISGKSVDLYGLVKKVSEHFGLPVPKIIVANTAAPNAAASGISPRRGTVLATTGLLIRLSDDEILSVLAHEMSHLKARDPLILYALTSAEYLLRVYILLPLFFFIPFFLYFFFTMWLIYFVAKFLEARADLEAAIRLGKPQSLASALRKIGFRRLQMERASPGSRFQAWLGWDAHPPLYFRINRLENLESPERIRHPLLQSIKDSINAFLSAF